MNYLLIGKPNVGKSSIYNILVGRNENIIHSDSGTTRDWHKQLIMETSCYIFDTPGVLINDTNDKKIINFTFNEILKKKIDFFLYVIDFNNAYNESDHFAINKIRKFNKKIFLIINKSDNFKKISKTIFFQYGIEDISFISCAHRLGIKDLKKLILQNNNLNLHTVDFDYSLAIFGKPNVGKSTFVNKVLGYDRVITSPIAGTTSDSVSDVFIHKSKSFKIIDTAGIDKKSNVFSKSLNEFSIKKSFETIIKVDAAFIIIDSINGLDRQDKRIISLISDKAKNIILIFNKIDLIEHKDKFKIEIIDEIKNTLHEVKNIKIFFISAFSKKHIIKILDYLIDSIFLVTHKISTSKLNSWLKKVTLDKTHPLIEHKKINFKYAVQVKDNPITIKIFCNFSSKLKQNYKRYLINNFNYHFKILNQKTKIIYSSSKNPYI